ncbi:MAG: aminoglycoside phosphotransferase family protein [Amnibacterium sp.]
MDPGSGSPGVPASLAWLRNEPGGSEWLTRLPGLVDAAARSWHLTLEEPYPDAFASLALRARTAAGTPVVLKLQFPDRESRPEGEALAAWSGRGAVRLLDRDDERRALLLERCVPGTSLLASPAEALEVLSALLPRLWIPAPEGMPTLTAEASHWRDGLEAAWARTGRALPRPVLDVALLALMELPGTQDEPVLLNQDLHAGNVLRAEREPWLVIDPKPLAGERAFGLAPVLRDVARRDPAALLPALDRLTRVLRVDRERARRWTLAQTVAWAFDGQAVDPLHAAVASMLLTA